MMRAARGHKGDSLGLRAQKSAGRKFTGEVKGGAELEEGATWVAAAADEAAECAPEPGSASPTAPPEGRASFSVAEEGAGWAATPGASAAVDAAVANLLASAASAARRRRSSSAFGMALCRTGREAITPTGATRRGRWNWFST